MPAAAPHHARAARPPQAAPAAPPPVLQLAASDCQRLAGVSVGGWVVVSLLAGAALGAAAVLLAQALRRRRDVRYAGLSGGAAASAKPLRSSSPELPPLAPSREPAHRAPRASLPPPAPAGGGAVFSPLTASVHAAPGLGAKSLGARASVAVAAAAAAAAAGAGDTCVADQAGPRKQVRRALSGPPGWHDATGRRPRRQRARRAPAHPSSSPPALPQAPGGGSPVRAPRGDAAQLEVIRQFAATDCLGQARGGGGGGQAGGRGRPAPDPPGRGADAPTSNNPAPAG
jgi:hypothetical protein